MTSTKDFPQLFEVIVGSRAHGLATPESDYDYRSVFAVPTSHILSLGNSTLKSGWMAGNVVDGKGGDDKGGTEVASFMNYVVKGHPNFVEMLFAPLNTLHEEDGNPYPADTPMGEELRYVLIEYGVNVEGLMRAAIGYAQSCLDKLITPPDGATAENQKRREPKWATAYLRVLSTLGTYLHTGVWHVKVDELPSALAFGIKAAREGSLSPGDVMTQGKGLEAQILGMHEGDYSDGLRFEPDMNELNYWLLHFRRETWD